MVFRLMVLAGVISQVFRAWVPVNVEVFLVNLITRIEVSHFKHTRALSADRSVDDASRCCIITMNGRWGLRVAQFFQCQAKYSPIPHIQKNAPSSASAADAATNLRMVHSVKKAPLRRMGSPSRGVQPRKKCPAARLLPCGSERYEASEWMLSIISEA